MILLDEHGRFLAHNPEMKPKKEYHSDGADPAYKVGVYEFDIDPSIRPNLVTSKTLKGHKPLLDLDFPCRLLPSSTPGKFHLYMDGIELTDEQHLRFLNVLAEVGIIQRRWAANADPKHNGAVGLRQPITPAVGVDF